MRRFLVVIFMGVIGLLIGAGITGFLQSKEKKVIRMLEKTVEAIKGPSWQPAPLGPKETAHLLISPQGDILVAENDVDTKFELKNEKYTVQLKGTREEISYLRLIDSEKRQALWQINPQASTITYGHIPKGYAHYETKTKSLSPKMKELVGEIQQALYELINQAPRSN